MSESPDKSYFENLYKVFSKPLADLDCGEKCGPYNDYGVPVCCDIGLLVPAAYKEEWAFLKDSTDLWHLWQDVPKADFEDLQDELQSGQILLECLGYQRCQRPFRSVTCRAFPFFPYLSSEGEFIGLAYYREFRDQCWIISNLNIVSSGYIKEFQNAYMMLFENFPESRISFIEYSEFIRDQISQKGEDLVVIGFTGLFYKVDLGTEEVNQVSPADLDSYGPFKIARELVFPDELTGSTNGTQHG